MAEDLSSKEQLTALLGEPLRNVWNQLCDRIDELYEMDRSWNDGGKAWDLEYKYRRGGKTLCALYAKKDCIGFMVILGKDERARFESDRESYSEAVQKVYDNARTYHDGKWMMFEPTDDSQFDDYLRLLAIKRRPNRKHY